MLLADNWGRIEKEENAKAKQAEVMHHRQAAMVKRSDKKRNQRRLHIERREALEKKKYLAVRETSEKGFQEIKETCRLAKEVSCREKSQEKSKLNKLKSAARFPSNCALELARSEIINEKIEQDARSAKLINEWYQNGASEKKVQEESKRKKENYRGELQVQIIQHLKEVRKKEEEKHRDRKILEESEDIINQESLEEEKQRKEAVTIQKAERDGFLKARQLWKVKRKEILKNEYTEHARTQAFREEKEKLAADKEAEIRLLKEVIKARLAEELLEEERRKREKENLINEFYLEEAKGKVTNEGVKSAMKKKQATNEALMDVMRQHKMAEERKAKEDVIDSAFARYLMEEDKIANEKKRLQGEERRRKSIQYGGDLRDAMNENRVKYAMEILKKQSDVNSN